MVGSYGTAPVFPGLDTFQGPAALRSYVDAAQESPSQLASELLSVVTGVSWLLSS